jgi:hypothetical protein
VVLPLSTCATMPMFRILSNGVDIFLSVNRAPDENKRAMEKRDVRS